MADKARQLKTVKQTLTDWQVTRGGAHAAWIRKGKDGLYTVTWHDDPEPYVTTTFKDAKDMAYRVASI
jgi:hypothetical protein